MHEQDFGMIGREIAALHSLSDERPQDKSLICGLEVKHDVERLNEAVLLDEKYPAKEFSEIENDVICT